MSNPSLRVSKIVWFALTTSQLIYGVVGMIVSPEVTEITDMLIIVLALVGVFNAVLAFVLVPMFFKVTSQENVLPLFILQWALIESIAIFGLMGKILAGSMMFLIGMIAMSVIFMLLLFPSDKRWNEMVQPE